MRDTDDALIAACEALLAWQQEAEENYACYVRGSGDPLPLPESIIDPIRKALDELKEARS